MENPLRIPADLDFRLIETALWTPEGGVHNADLHLARLGRTADLLGIVPLGLEDAIAIIQADGPRRLRLTVDCAGAVHVAVHPFAPLPSDAVWRIAPSPTRLSSEDPWLQVKTTQRALYDQARATLPDGIDELIFLNERGEVCEGTITNVFVDLGQGLLTPPAPSGLLPGVLRQRLLQSGQAREDVLTWDDLLRAEVIYVGNSLRGLIRAEVKTDMKFTNQAG